MGTFFKDSISGIENVDRTSITEAVNDAYKTIDALAIYMRQKSDDLLNALSKVSPDEMCDFNKRNGVYMLRLMHLNEQENEITLTALGVDAVVNGDHTAITGSAISPSYAKNMNYKDNFAARVSTNEIAGIESTQKSVIKNGKTGITEIVNLYPDESATGNFDNKWNTANQNSTLNKTKKLFAQHKINTIISRFHTDPTTPTNAFDVKSKYGLSHGRNLLTKDAEIKGGTYNVNGYDNPYCRVWTHHHQYDELKKLIRPFKTDTGVVMLPNLHQWKNFNNYGNIKTYKNGEPVFSDQEKGWKYKNDAWEKSVLNTTNGMVNITPKYINGGNTNIHTKQCMFSIENLAWKGYDPYSFEKALPWEQRGPMGGRIMWFPPYGISFNETTTANWTANSFIGRGEDVYTYVNTVRSGTLNFMMVVDHPSVLDYVQWWNPSEDKVSEDDVHRFFAGCDSGDSNDENSLLHYAKPTPLTDEYVNVSVNDADPIEAKKKPTDDTDREQQIDVTFYVFFPNNYSGYYDRTGSKVEAIPYLLYGKGAQMKVNDNFDFNSGASVENQRQDPTEPIPVNFTQYQPEYYGNGYEINDTKGISVNIEKSGENEENSKYEGNFIIGCTVQWSAKKSEYVIDETKKWYYRIDGEYKCETTDSSNEYKNCYDQALTTLSNYSDTTSEQLNLNAEKVRAAFPEENKNKYLFTLSDVAEYLCKTPEIKNKISSMAGDVFEQTMKDYTVDSIDITGYSNSHCNKDANPRCEELNNSLALERANTVKDWLENNSEWKGKIKVQDPIASKPVDNTAINSMEAKKYRSAKVTMHLSTNSSSNASDTDQSFKPYESFDVKELLNNIIKEIKTIINNHEPSDDIKKDDKLKSIEKIYKTVQFYPSVLDEIKECLVDQINIKEVESLYTLLSDDGYKKLFEELPNYVIETSVNEFGGFEEFDSKLGKILREKILTLKYVKDLQKDVAKKEGVEVEKLENELAKLNDELNNIVAKIEDLKKENEAYDNEIEGYRDEIKDKEHDRDTLIRELQSTEDENRKKEYSNRINNISKEIENLNKKIENLQTKIVNNVRSIDDLTYNEKKSYEEKIIFKEEELESLKDEIYNNLSNVVQLKSGDLKKTIKDYLKNNVDVEDKNYDEMAEDIEKLLISTTLIQYAYDDENGWKIDIVFGGYDEKDGWYFQDQSNKDQLADLRKKQKDFINNYNGIIYDKTDILKLRIKVDSTKLLETLKKYTTNEYIAVGYFSELSDTEKGELMNGGYKKRRYKKQNDIYVVDYGYNTEYPQYKFVCYTCENSEIYSTEEGIKSNIADVAKDYTINWTEELIEPFVKYLEDTNTHHTIENKVQRIDFDINLNKIISAPLWYYSDVVIKEGDTQGPSEETEITPQSEETSNEETTPNPNEGSEEKGEENPPKDKITLDCSKGETIDRIQGYIDQQAEEKKAGLDNSEYIGFSRHETEDGEVYYINENETDPDKMGRHWILVDGQFVLKHQEIIQLGGITVNSLGEKESNGANNTYRYDQEYHFFEVLKEKNRMGYETLMEKIRYFNPAYHSMTPEGFNERLTFLNQCMRQGNTVSAADKSGTANNLAFGRAPYCVLRLGDFYNQMIVIDNISIQYDSSNGLQWDLNAEGIGVQPLLANISISFKFIGGGDMSGPVKRLQNAMSFNYYANASLYDNRADRMSYTWDEKTNGAFVELENEKSYFHNVETYKKK